MALPQLHSGARGVLTITGLTGTRTLLFITDVSVTITASVRAPHTFGSPAARSVEPLSTGCTVSLGRVVPVNRGDGTPVDSSAIAMGIEPAINMMTQAEDIQVTLVDEVTGTTVANVLNCRFSGRTFGNSAANLANERITLTGIYDAAGGNTARVGF